MKDGIKFILVVISMMFSITGQFEWGILYFSNVDIN